MLPKNCHVRVATAPEGLPFADNSFDFVVQHDMAIRYTRKQWDDALKELVRVTKPGGYLELGMSISGPIIRVRLLNFFFQPSGTK